MRPMCRLEISIPRLFLASLFATAPGFAVDPPLVAGAFNEIARRVDENQSGFFVYKDVDSAFNHGFPSGLFGALDRIQVNGACLEEPSSPSACSTNLARLDRVRGTVLQIAFLPLAPAQFAGLNFEEPERWGIRPRGVGFNLTGATGLLLRARSPNGVRVQFGLGGSTTQFVTIPSDWTDFSFPLSLLSPPVALGDVHLLFTVATNASNAPAGGVVFLDDVRVAPLPISQAAVPSLPLSNQTFGVVQRTEEASGRVPIPLDQQLRNVSTLYESAITIQALIRRGTSADAARARNLVAGLRYALTHDNHGDFLPVASDGSRGLHNAYETGDLTLLNDQEAPGAGVVGDIRLAGFSAGTTLCGPSGYCLVGDGATGGNNAFAILALLDAYEAWRDPRDLSAARTLARWMSGVLTDPSTAGFGGYFLGYPDEGVPPPKPLLRSKSVENNADIFAAFSRLAAIERRLGNQAAATLWTARANTAGDFVLRMFDSSSGCFFAGTVPTDTSAAWGIDPSGERRGNDVVNTYLFLDSQSFTSLALMGSARYRNRIDWRRPTQCMLARFRLAVSAAGRRFQGFGLVHETVGPRGVAWEFTAQAIQFMREVDRRYGESRYRTQVSLYLGQLLQAQRRAPFGDGIGLVASTLDGGGALLPIEQCLSTPFQCIPERVGLAATAWAIFAGIDFNPLRLQ